MATIKDLVPKPKSRNLIVGSVGSGKSTVGCAVLEGYHAQHRGHSLYIIDPKHRFVPVDRRSESVFPEGFGAKEHGRVEGVATTARPIHLGTHRRAKPGVWLVHDMHEALELFDRLFQHADVRRPVMIYNDESFDMQRNGLLDYRFKRIVQMGREKGIGHITINQRPKRIDTTLISESERIYVGTLHNVNDRKALAETVAIPESKELLTPMPMHEFWLIDQVHPDRSFRFTLNV